MNPSNAGRSELFPSKKMCHGIYADQDKDIGGRDQLMMERIKTCQYNGGG